MNRSTAILLLKCVAVGALLAQGTVHPPTNLTAQPLSGNYPRVYLSWQNAPGSWYCNLYRSVNDTLHFVRIASVGGQMFEDRGVTGGRTYYYYLRAVAWVESSMVEGPRSIVVSATLGSAGGVRGTIRGTVVDDSTAAPIRNVRVRFFRVSSSWTGQYDLTDSLGTYEAQVDTGRYLIKAEPPCEPAAQPQYRPEWYNNAPDPMSATIVVVTAGGTVTADFGLRRMSAPRLSSISGVVRNEQGQALPGATVAIMRSIQEMHRIAATTGTIPGLGPEERQLPSIGYTRGVIWSGTSDHQGRFRAVVPAGGSYIAAAGRQGFLLQYFHQTTDPTRAVTIAATSDTSDVNFILRPTTPTPNTINGTVRDSTGETVPSRVILFPRPPSGQPPTQVVHSGASGEYRFANVPTGSYLVLALPYSNYGAAFFKEGEFGVTQWQLADSVVVQSSQATAHVGVQAVAGDGLVTASGVALSSTGEPLVGARVVVHNSFGGLVGTSFSSASGIFSVDALPFGDVTFIVDREPYNPQLLSVTIPINTYVISNLNVVLTRPGTTQIGVLDNEPGTFELEQNYPNPFNPSTTIRFHLPKVGGRSARTLHKENFVSSERSEVSRVTLKVYDVLGRAVSTLLDEELLSGSYEIRWDASAFAGGVYFYRLQAGGAIAVRKMLLVK